jgi:hypothetical protein
MGFELVCVGNFYLGTVIGEDFDGIDGDACPVSKRNGLIRGYVEW